MTGAGLIASSTVSGFGVASFRAARLMYELCYSCILLLCHVGWGRDGGRRSRERLVALVALDGVFQCGDDEPLVQLSIGEVECVIGIEPGAQCGAEPGESASSQLLRWEGLRLP